jgi:hypothetical protein
MYKSHLLSFVEYRTPAIYHAIRAVLCRLDHVQSIFLREVGINEQTALLKHNLAPLSTRRDIAMLGLIHRTVLKKGPLHFRDHFVREASPPPGVRRHHSRHVVDPRLTCHGRAIARSALGLVAVYNQLPPYVAMLGDVSTFQTALQRIVKARAIEGHSDWAQSLCPRLPLASHPILCVPQLAPALAAAATDAFVETACSEAGAS